MSLVKPLTPDQQLDQYFFRWLTQIDDDLNVPALAQMSSNLLISRILGRSLAASNLLRIGFAVNPTFFANNFIAIFDALSSAGTYKAYVILIRLMLGEKTSVKFENPHPAHLIIKILEDVQEKGLITKRYQGIITRSGFGIKIKSSSSTWAMSQILAALKNVQQTGVFVEYDLTE